MYGRAELKELETFLEVSDDTWHSGLDTRVNKRICVVVGCDVILLKGVTSFTADSDITAGN